jgi:uncharacterized protein (UPF0335 family)
MQPRETIMLDQSIVDGAPSATVHASQLRSIIERIERLEEEKKEVGEQITEVYGEAKGNGFDPKILRKVISLRRKTAEARSEEEAILDLYMQALGMLSS